MPLGPDHRQAAWEGGEADFRPCHLTRDQGAAPCVAKAVAVRRQEQGAGRARGGFTGGRLKPDQPFQRVDPPGSGPGRAGDLRGDGVAVRQDGLAQIVRQRGK